MNTYPSQEQVRASAAEDAATEKVFLSNPPEKQESIETLFKELAVTHSKTLEYLAK
jgi:hypothetical protein